jgi:O-antigen/teichoic acid export membrane protein
MQMAAGDNSMAARLKLVNYSGAALGRIVFPIFFFFFFFRYEVITVVFSDRYADAVPLFAISVFVLPLRAYNYTSILQHLNQVKIINWGAVLDLAIALALAYPLFLWLGLQGVALAFVICSYIQAAFYLVHTSRLMRCSVLQLIPWKQWLVMVIVFGLAGIGLHWALTRVLSAAQAMILGFAGTVVVIALALAPLMLRRRESR